MQPSMRNKRTSKNSDLLRANPDCKEGGDSELRKISIIRGPFKLLRAAGFILAIGLNTTVLLAEEAPSPSNEFPVAKPIYLSLQKAIESTLKNNITIAVRRLIPRFVNRTFWKIKVSSTQLLNWNYPLRG